MLAEVGGVRLELLSMLIEVGRVKCTQVPNLLCRMAEKEGQPARRINPGRRIMHIMGGFMTAVGIVLMLLFLWWFFKDDIVDRTNEARRLRNEDETK